MSISRYEGYKESGLPWLREIPTHWDTIQSRRLFSLRKEKATPNDRQLTASQKHGVIYQDDYMAQEGQRVVQVLIGADILKHVEPNDFVISMRSFQGGIEWCGLRGSISSAYVMLIPSESVHVKFFSYLFKCRPYIQALQSTSNLVRDGQALRYENFTLIDLPVIPYSEQQAIAEFLSHETTKIDALIAEQEHLIELLNEKRQSVISQAVTKGLNHAASMKDSGVEWMGRVPAHWDVGPLKRAFSSVDYGISDSLEASGEVAVLRMGNIGGGKVIMDDFKYVDSVDIGLLLKEGDLLYNRTNSLDLIGKVGLFAGGSHARVTFASYLVRLRTSADCVPGYFGYMLNTVGMLGAARANAIVAIGQCNLNPTRYGALIVAIPPQSEQRDILAFLDEQTSKLDTLVAEANSAVSLLLERRSALISAAVTGKIDVRDSVAVQMGEAAAE
jgi:type I restriction enzyme, S subunit